MSNTTSIPRASRALVTVFLLFLLTACGTNTSTNHSPGNSSPSRPVSDLGNTHHSASDTAPSLNKSLLSTDVEGLHIQADNGFQCPFDPSDGFPMASLVLATTRLTYSQDEIDQMTAYVGTHEFVISLLRPDLSGAAALEPPPTLRWVPGTSVDPIPGSDLGKGVCGSKLEITNTGNTPVQIPNAGVQLLGTPQQNTYHYRLIDACSIILKLHPDYCNPGGRGNQTMCDTYFASIQLGIGERNSIFSVAPVPHAESEPNDQGTPVPCGVLTIAPKAQAYLEFSFSPVSGTPKNLIYSVVPVLTVDSADGRHMLSLSQLTSTLTFADASQFSCYRLQGTTFVLGDPSTLQYSPDKLWCM